MQLLTKALAHKPDYPERVVQFGAGNFLRAFADWVIDRLNEETDFAGTVVIVKPTPGGDYDALNAQDGLYHVQLHSIQQGNLSTQTRLIRCISRSIHPYHAFADYLELARQPELRFIISNTTENGIAFRPEDKLSDAPPLSFPAKLTRFLYERYRYFEGSRAKGFIILPCELIEDNATTLKRYLLDYADVWALENDFKDWLVTANSFCTTLVDRIVTGFPAEAEQLFAELSCVDRQLVTAEAYHQWVIQGPQWLKDEFPCHKTSMQVIFSDNLKRYRDMKVRILNGAHTAMFPVAYLKGLRTVDEAMHDADVAEFIEDLLRQEVLPSLDLPQNELGAFAKATLERFQNPYLKHQLSAIALNSSAKFSARLLPSLLSYQAKKAKIPVRIAFSFACLIRFYQGIWQAEVLPVRDSAEILSWWQKVWQHSSSEAVIKDVLANSNLWGQDLNSLAGFSELLSTYLQRLEHEPITDILRSLR